MYITIIILLNITVITTIFIVNSKYRKKPLLKDYFLLFLIGFLAAGLALVFNIVGRTILLTLFSNNVYIEKGQLYFRNGFYYILYYLIYYFLIVGVSEELSKNLIPMIMCNNNENRSKTSLDCLLHFMIVACVFSCVEDYMYIKNGTHGIVRLLTVFGGHLLYSLIFYISFIKYKIRDKAYSIGSLIKHKTWKTEGNTTLTGFNKKFSNEHYLKKSFIFAILCHGTYNFIVTVFHESFFTFLFIILLNVLFIVLFVLTLNNQKNLKEEGINLFIQSFPYYTKEKLIELEIIKE